MRSEARPLGLDLELSSKHLAKLGRTVSHPRGSELLEPCGKHLYYRLLFRRVKVTLELALTETAIVSSADCAAGTPRSRSRSSAASRSFRETIPRRVRIFSTSTQPPR